MTRPLKVEEGLLLNVLQVAATKGHVPLAEATWQVGMGGLLSLLVRPRAGHAAC